jgi:hypothetical protein
MWSDSALTKLATVTGFPCCFALAMDTMPISKMSARAMDSTLFNFMIEPPLYLAFESHADDFIMPQLIDFSPETSVRDGL